MSHVRKAGRKARQPLAAILFRALPADRFR